MPKTGSKEAMVDKNEENLCDSCASREACPIREDVSARYRIPTSNVRVSKCGKFLPSDKRKALYRKLKRIAAPLH